MAVLIEGNDDSPMVIDGEIRHGNFSISKSVRHLKSHFHMASPKTHFLLYNLEAKRLTYNFFHI